MWKTLKKFVSKRPIGCTVTRQDILFHLSYNPIFKHPRVTKLTRTQENTVDSYRCILTTAGYLETVGRGVYKLLKKVPKDLTWDRAVIEAYGYSHCERKKNERKRFRATWDKSMAKELRELIKGES